MVGIDSWNFCTSNTFIQLVPGLVTEYQPVWLVSTYRHDWVIMIYLNCGTRDVLFLLDTQSGFY